MKAWTYLTSPKNGPYWQSGGTPIILLEYPDGQLEWRLVSTGGVYRGASTPISGHKGALLPRRYWPAWYADLDENAMDEGL